MADCREKGFRRNISFRWDADLDMQVLLFSFVRFKIRSF